MDLAYYEEIAGLLHGLAIRLDDRLRRRDLDIVGDYLDHNELGLALEHMAEMLGADAVAISEDERRDMLALADRMEMDGQVASALARCPERA